MPNVKQNEQKSLSTKQANPKQTSEGKSKLHRNWRWYAGALAVFLVLFVWVMGASAEAPGDFGYPIKRAEETAGIVLTFYSRDAQGQAYFDAGLRRIHEATVVADRIPNESADKQVVDAQRIQDLMNEYTQTSNNLTTSYAQLIDQGTKFPPDQVKKAERSMTKSYGELVELRLAAPPEAQSAVLQAITTFQTSLAGAQDLIGQAPVTPEDSDELTKLVSQGFLTREELTKLLTGATSNRNLLDKLRELVRDGRIPAATLYAIDYDLLAEYDKKVSAQVQAGMEFDELRKIAIFSAVITPTPDQQEAVKKFMAGYKFGDQLPRDASRSYIMPLVYGLQLTPNLANDLKQLNANDLSPVRRALYDAWKPLVSGKTTDTKQLYANILQITDSTVARDTTLMERVQLELLKALRSDVVYLALPPGWTASQVATMAGDFDQQIKTLKSLSTIQATSQTATASLASITTPLIAPLPEAKVDAVRQDLEKQLAALQQKLIDSAASAANAKAVASDLTQQVSAIQNSFNTQLATLGKTNSDTTAQVTALKNQLAQALQNATDAKAKLQAYVTADLNLQDGMQQNFGQAETAQNQMVADLQSGLDKVSSAHQSVKAELASSMDTIKQTISQNIASLKGQLADTRATQAASVAALETTLIGQYNQIADLQAQLSLSDTAHSALKTETAQIISTLRGDQATAVASLQKTINDVSSLHTQLNVDAQKQIGDIKIAQAQLLTSLQNEVNDRTVLKDELHASVSALQTAQDQAETKITGLATNHDTLKTQLSDIKTLLTDAQQAIKNNVADTKVARAELQGTIDTLKSAQTLTNTQISDGLAALTLQVGQATGQLNAGHEQTVLAIADLTTDVGQAKTTLAQIQSIQLDTTTQLQVQAKTTADLRAELTGSLNQLQTAQVATQAKVDALSTNVTDLKTSLTAITQTQNQAQGQINQLLTASLAWSAIPSTLQFNQDQFRQYQQQLADEFAAKAALLQQQFEGYKQQLDGNIQTLKTDVNAQLTQLKADQAALKTALQQAQTQLQQLQSVQGTTTTSTTMSTSGMTSTSSTSTILATPTPTPQVAATPAPTPAPTLPGL